MRTSLGKDDLFEYGYDEISLGPLVTNMQALQRGSDLP